MVMQTASSRSLKLSKVSGGLRQTVNGAVSKRSNARSARLFGRSDNPIAPETRTQAPMSQTTLKRERARGLIVDEALSMNRPLTPSLSPDGGEGGRRPDEGAGS